MSNGRGEYSQIHARSLSIGRSEFISDPVTTDLVHLAQHTLGEGIVEHRIAAVHAVIEEIDNILQMARRVEQVLGLALSHTVVLVVEFCVALIEQTVLLQGDVGLLEVQIGLLDNVVGMGHALGLTASSLGLQTGSLQLSSEHGASRAAATARGRTVQDVGIIERAIHAEGRRALKLSEKSS